MTDTIVTIESYHALGANTLLDSQLTALKILSHSTVGSCLIIRITICFAFSDTKIKVYKDFIICLKTQLSDGAICEIW